MLPKVWEDTLNEHVANNIPLHLIDVETMGIAGREEVKTFFRPALKSYLEQYPQEVASHRINVVTKVASIVKYATLSHRWFASGEPTFQDATQLRSTSASGLVTQVPVTIHAAIKRMGKSLYSLKYLLSGAADAPESHPPLRVGDGFHKLAMFCSKAREYGCRFAWSDTCCINKTSSAELDESIRSMFRWYRNAAVCITYLGSTTSLDNVAQDEWFTRGWTLQELLAPRSMKFSSKDWLPLTNETDDKDPGLIAGEDQHPLWTAIISVTRIPEEALLDFQPGTIDIAERMSWAADRRTTRAEDMAYSLIGIFDISIPIQYGEGRAAFFRLLREILLLYPRFDMLRWSGTCSRYNDALPASPSCYPPCRTSSEPERLVYVSTRTFGDPIRELTNRGLRLEVFLVPMVLETPTRDSNVDVTERQLVADSGEWDYKLCQFVLRHQDDTFLPVSLRGQLPNPPYSYEYAIAILQYARSESDDRNAFVPFYGTTCFLGFVLHRYTGSRVWKKMVTADVVEVEVRPGLRYEGKTAVLQL